MNVDTNHIILLSQRLEKEFAQGNRWASYEDKVSGINLFDMSFFPGRTDATKHVFSQQSEVEDWKVVKILPLLRELQKAQVYDRESFNVRMYDIDDNSFKLSRGYKSDSEPYWSWQADPHAQSLTLHSQLIPVGTKRPAPVDYENLRQLCGQLSTIGLKGEYWSDLEQNMKEGRSFFGVKGYEKIGDDSLAIQLAFVKTDAGDYDLIGYKTTLYNHSEVDHSTINGIDTRPLDQTMKAADWNIDLIESEKEWVEAYKVTGTIEDSLRLLSHNEQGARLAVQLWNNYVDPSVFDKPAFLQRIEGRMGMYAQTESTPDKQLQQTYEYLKRYNEIADQISRLGIARFDERQTKIDAIETMLDGRQYSIVVPTTTMLSTKIARYHISEHARQGFFTSGLADERKGVATTYSEAMDVLSREIASANNDPARRRNDFTVVGEQVKKNANKGADQQNEDQPGCLIAIANNSWNGKDIHSPIEPKIITNPLLSPILESLYMFIDEVTRALKFHNVNGIEFKKDVGGQFRPETHLTVIEHPTRIECVNTSDIQNRPTLYEKLAEYPIIELDNDTTAYKILDSLVEGFSEQVTLHRELRPSEHIERFVVLEHEYSKGSLNEYNQKIIEVSAAKTYDEALEKCFEHLATIAGDTAGSRDLEVMLIGEYRGKKLDFNFEGSPEVNTGHLILTGYPTSFEGNHHRYEVVQDEDHRSLITVTETLYIKLDQQKGVILFADILKGQKEIDKDFWSIPGASRQQDVLLSSIQNENNGACNKKIAGDSHDVNDSLITKLRTSSERGYRL